MYAQRKVGTIFYIMYRNCFCCYNHHCSENERCLESIVWQNCASVMSLVPKPQGSALYFIKKYTAQSILILCCEVVLVVSQRMKYYSTSQLLPMKNIQPRVCYKSIISFTSQFTIKSVFGKRFNYVKFAAVEVMIRSC